MAGEFQTHVDDMLREANLSEVRDSIAQIRNFDIRAEVERTIDPDHSIRDTFSSNPLVPSTNPPTPAPAETLQSDVAVVEAPALTDVEAELTPAVAESAKPDAPAFVPPGLVPHLPAAARDTEAPAFIPPSIVLQRSSRPVRTDD
jgi:sec-independent protein translocase protein TatB